MTDICLSENQRKTGNDFIAQRIMGMKLQFTFELRKNENKKNFQYGTFPLEEWFDNNNGRTYGTWFKYFKV